MSTYLGTERMLYFTCKKKKLVHNVSRAFKVLTDNCHGYPHHHLNIEPKVYRERIFLQVQHCLPVEVCIPNNFPRSGKPAAFVGRC
jgi:hypothetical protein